MNVRITPAVLQGTISALGSKSAAHRHLICAALSDNTTEIMHCTHSEDIEATAGCLRALGATITREGNTLSVHPMAAPHSLVAAHTSQTITPTSQAATAVSKVTLNCAESGSTLRFMLPVAAATCNEDVHLIGGGRLPMRPLEDLANTLRQNGMELSSNHLPLVLRGVLKSGQYTLPGNISSQYITGLLLALPLLQGTSEIVLTTPLESTGYVDITLGILEQYGVVIKRRANGFSVPGGQQYRSPGKVYVEGDWSNAAFFLAAGALGRPVTVAYLPRRSLQGDRALISFLERFGAEVFIDYDEVSVFPKTLQGCTIDIGETPDLLPALAVVAAYAQGETHFSNGARLRLKESDRLLTTATLLSSLGGEVKLLPDGLLVRGSRLTGGRVDSCNDHRIAMAAALAASACTEPVIIQGAEAVAKSYPAFFADYQKLGGIVDVI